MIFAEFFAGIGLVRVGLEKAGWSCGFANDIDPKKLQMYSVRFTDSASHFALGDIRTLDTKQIPQVDLATASFPCTDLSLAGSRAGLAGKQSSAFWPFLDILHSLGSRRPKLVMLENVPGLLTSNRGDDFRQVLLALNEVNYTVDALIVDASRFVPQSRPRLFVVAAQAPSHTLVNEPGRTQSFFESEVRPAALARFILENPSIRWNVREMPPLPVRTSRLDSILEQLPSTSPEWWNQERALYLLSQMSPRHGAIAQQMIATSQISYGTVFRRVRNGKSMAELRIDGIAGCLRTPKGGSGRQILFEAGNGRFRVRLLTARECARLMGADDFPITVPANQALFGFGDAVCVPVIEWLARHYLNAEFEAQQLSLPKYALA